MKHAKFIKLIYVNKRNKIMVIFENINQNTSLPAQILQSLLITFRIKFSSPWSAKLCGVTLAPPSSAAVSVSLCSSHAGLLAVPSTCWPHNLFTCSFLYLEQNFPQIFAAELVPHFIQNLAHLSFPSTTIYQKHTSPHSFPFFLLFHFIILITIWCPIIHSCLCILFFPLTEINASSVRKETMSCLVCMSST